MSNEELVLMIQSGQDKEKNLEELYLGNIGMITKVAYKYSSYAEYDDLMQEAFIGMYKAVELWDPKGGANFMTYAYNWMCAAVQRYITNCGTSVRVPHHQYQKILKYERVVRESLLQNPRGLSDKELAAFLGMTQADLEELKKDAQVLKVRSLDAPISDENESLTLGDAVPDEKDDFETLDDEIQNEELAQELWPIVDSLEPIQAKTIRARYQDGLTLKQTAERLDITKDKAKYSESMALRELRRSEHKKRLRPYLPDDEIYSLSIENSGYGYFMNTWTSAPETVVLIEEKRARGKNR